MKPIITFITILFITLLSSPSWSETMEDLVKRDGLYYKKFTDVPFSGVITGQRNGKIKKGKRSGLWKIYNENGQLSERVEYKDGKIYGLWEYYYENGQVTMRGNFKDGKPHGLLEDYYENGQLSSKGSYRDGKKEGLWEYFNKDGSVNTEKTGIYNDDKLIE